MRTLTRLLLISLGVVLMSAAAPTLARAQDNNAAVAINTKDGSSIFKVAFSIKRLSDSTVDSQNAAIAYSNCTECQTVAVAIQIVLVVDDPNEVTPTNVAIAYNDNCDSCQTMAAAYQFVFGAGDDTKFSPEGKRRLHELRKQLHDLRKANLPIDQIDAQLQQIVQGIADVLDNELQPADATASTTTTSTTLPGDSNGTTSSTSSTTSTTRASTTTTSSSTP